jgi:phospholipase/lecithinase/hemolysin
MKTVMLLIVSGLLLVSCASAPTRTFTQVVAFGDSFVDTGNGLQLLKQAVEAKEATEYQLDELLETSWEGRATNGPLAVEILASKLNASLTSYGVIESRSDLGSNLESMSSFQNTGLLGQVFKYIDELGGKQADPSTLFFISTGSYDLALHLIVGGSTDDKRMTYLADQTINNLSKAVTRLAGAGAKQFLIVNTLDLASIPAMIDGGFSKPAKVFQDRKVAQMPVEMEALAQELQIEIQVFDFVAAVTKIRDDAGKYDLTNLTAPCFLGQGPCAKPEEYYWWTGTALSARVHEVLGEMMAEQISK